MTLIVILNAALAAGIVGVIVALHVRAIVTDHRQHRGTTKLWTWRPDETQPAVAEPHQAPRTSRRTTAAHA
jgi:sugar phosphate permease